MERVNVRNLKPEPAGETAACRNDLSFISLSLVLRSLKILVENAKLFAS
jgi:predicted rRNA methylase YqxC with S4 and FtsJ domains